DVESRRQLASHILSHPDAVVAMALWPGSRTVVTSCADRIVRAWDIDRAEILQSLGTGDSVVNSLSVAADGRVVGVNSEARSVVAWDLAAARNPGAGDGRRPQTMLDFKVVGGLVWSAV